MRRALAILACLVLGAVVNIGVAWWLNAATVGLQTTILLRDASAAAKGWPVAVPSAWESPDLWEKRASTGCTETVVVSGALKNEYGSVISTSWIGHQAVELEDVGWPMRALRSQRVGSFEGAPRGPLPSTTFASWRVGIVRSTAISALGVSGSHVRYIPVFPIWTGFIANSVFFGATVWLAILGVPRLMRWNRRRRGRCPACAYPVGASPVCTECGATVTPRPQAA
jgi:hypothetical protein